MRGCLHCPNFVTGPLAHARGSVLSATALNHDRKGVSVRANQPFAKYKLAARSSSALVMRGCRPSYLPIEIKMLQISDG
jgi:hypothetical protein